MFISRIIHFIKIGDDYSTTSGRIMHQTCTEDCPGLCTKDWIFPDDITQVIDDSNGTQKQKQIYVTCGK